MIEDLYELLYGTEEYSTFIDSKDITYRAIPRDTSGHATLGELIKL